MKRLLFLEGAWWRLTEIAASCMLLMSVPWRGGLCPRGSKEMRETTEGFYEPDSMRIVIGAGFGLGVTSLSAGLIVRISLGTAAELIEHKIV